MKSSVFTMFLLSGFKKSAITGSLELFAFILNFKIYFTFEMMFPRKRENKQFFFFFFLLFKGI